MPRRNRRKRSSHRDEHSDGEIPDDRNSQPQMETQTHQHQHQHQHQRQRHQQKRTSSATDRTSQTSPQQTKRKQQRKHPNNHQHQNQHQHQHQHQHRQQKQKQNRDRDHLKNQPLKNQRTKEERHTSSMLNHNCQTQILLWDSPVEEIPLREEEWMVRIFMDRNGAKERGMLMEKPPFLIRKFKAALQEHAPSMHLSQAWSLRRHHIKLRNSYQNMSQLRLGDINDIQASAQLFEDVVETFLKLNAIPYLTEDEQRKQAAHEQHRLVATPDFVLPTQGGVVLRKIRTTTNKREQQVVVEERRIHWIEAKMYYGASTIPAGKRNGAVGTIMETAQRYTKEFGPGAIVFMMGCGEQLATQLNALHISVLDCSSLHTVCLDDVHHHQRTWCANQKGEILP